VTEYDDMTPAEHARIDVERYAHDLGQIVTQLGRWRLDPLHAPFFPAEEIALFSSLTSLQLLCSTLEADRKSFERQGNVIPMFLQKRGASS
jgi:hypothetical protein